MLTEVHESAWSRSVSAQRREALRESLSARSGPRDVVMVMRDTSRLAPLLFVISSLRLELELLAPRHSASSSGMSGAQVLMRLSSQRGVVPAKTLIRLSSIVSKGPLSTCIAPDQRLAARSFRGPLPLLAAPKSFPFPSRALRREFRELL